MKLTRETLLGAYPQTPQTIQRRIDETLALIQNTEPMPKRPQKRLRLAMALLAVLALLAAIGIAAGYRLGVFDFMGGRMGPSLMLPEANKLVQRELAALETDHMRLSLSQAVFDGGHLRLLYSVRLKGASSPLDARALADENSAYQKTLTADGISLWGCDWFCIDGTEYIMTNGSTADTAIGAENGEALCYMDIHLASSGILPQQAFTVSLPIVRPANGNIQTLDFVVQPQTTAKALPPMIANGATVTVTSAAVTPVRTYANLYITRQASTSSQQFARIIADWQDTVLVNAQGDVLSALEKLELTAETPGENIRFCLTFLPTNAQEVWIAPTTINANNECAADMSQAIRIQ